MELKWKKDLNADLLDDLAGKALAQIDEMKYDAEMKEAGVSDILKLGIAFSGKHVAIKSNR
jgi:hypothetical protein